MFENNHCDYSAASNSVRPIPMAVAKPSPRSCMQLGLIEYTIMYANHTYIKVGFRLELSLGWSPAWVPCSLRQSYWPTQRDNGPTSRHRRLSASSMCLSVCFLVFEYVLQ